jgi:hypothetical protein
MSAEELLRWRYGQLYIKIPHALAKHEAAALTKKDVQLIEVAESVAKSHEAFGGLTMVKGKGVSDLVEGDLGQTFIIGALRSHDPIFQMLQAKI